MTKQIALKTIMFVSLGGVLFSGYLSYRELFLGSCNLGFVSCGVNTPPIFGVPACVYGLVMYSLIFVLSLVGQRLKK